MTDKLTKEEVHYSRGHVHSHCGPRWTDDTYTCRHFLSQSISLNRDGKCELVEGVIQPSYWCDRYQRAKK